MNHMDDQKTEGGRQGTEKKPEVRSQKLEEKGSEALQSSPSSQLLTPDSSAELRSADPLYSGRRHYPELDGLRAFAILGVIGLHFSACIPASQIAAGGRPVEFITRMFSHGAWGVDLFFVLSGYLITGILLASKGQAHYFRNFYARRTLRIFPLYYGTLLAILVILPLVLGRLPQMISAAYQHQVWLWTYTSNIYGGVRGGAVFGNFLHFWTLAIEEQFYLVWPLLVFLVPARRIGAVAVGIIILANISRIAFLCVAPIGDPTLVWSTLSGFTLFRADSLAFGAALAGLQYNRQLAEWRSTFLLLAPIAALLAISAAIFLPQYAAGIPVMLLAHVTLAPVLFGAGLGCVLTAKGSSVPNAILRTRILRTIGKYSYAMYVFHYIYLPLEIRWLPYALFLRLLRIPCVALATYLCIAAAIAFASAFISYHLYEKHFLKLKRHFPETIKASDGSAAWPVAHAASAKLGGTGPVGNNL